MDGAGNNYKKVLRSRNGVKVTLDDTDGQEKLIARDAGRPEGDAEGRARARSRSRTQRQLGQARSERDHGHRVGQGDGQRVDRRRSRPACVTVNAGMSKFSGVVQADTVITNSVVSTLVHARRGEHLVTADAPSVQWVTRRRRSGRRWTRGRATTGGRRCAGPRCCASTRDTFMDDARAAARRRDPRDARRRMVATPVTLPRCRPPGETDDRPPRSTDLKLYQPAHGHFYLVAAIARLPDARACPSRAWTRPRRRQVGFVLRRLEPATSASWAWVDDPTPSDGKQLEALDAGATRRRSPGEELLPLFPVDYTTRTRRAAAVRRARSRRRARESFKAARPLSPIAPEPTRAGRADRPAARRRSTTEGDRPARAPLAEASPRPGDRRRPRAVEDARASSCSTSPSFLARRTCRLVWRGDSWTRPAAAADARRSGHTLDDARGPAPARRAGARRCATAWDERLRSSRATPTGASSLSRRPARPRRLDPDDARRARRGCAAAARDAAIRARRDPIAGRPCRRRRSPKLDPRGAARYVLRCVYQRPSAARCSPTSSASRPSVRARGFFDSDAPARADPRSRCRSTRRIADLRKFAQERQLPHLRRAARSR